MDYNGERARLVEELRTNGIVNEGVLAAIGSVPRHSFVAPGDREHAYRDIALSLDQGQTISQPYIVALMISALQLRPDTDVLEVGTGSGYQAAVIAAMGHRVVTVERLPELSHRAETLLQYLGYRNVECVVGDGSVGWQSGAPWRAIIVAAGAPEPPAQLLDQLAEGGRLVLPVGPLDGQILRVISREGRDLLSTGLGAVRFVPLVGDAAWHQTGEGGYSR